MNPIYMAIARRKANNHNPDWDMGSLEVITNDATLVKCYKTETVTKGKNKGKKKYVGPPTIIVITRAEIAEEEANYEKTTGQCHRCYGKGEVPHSWSKDEGSKSKPCPRCKGTGYAPKKENP